MTNASLTVTVGCERIRLMLDASLALLRLSEYHRTTDKSYRPTYVAGKLMKPILYNVMDLSNRPVRNRQMDRQLRLPNGTWKSIVTAIRRGEGVGTAVGVPGVNQTPQVGDGNNCQVEKQEQKREAIAGDCRAELEKTIAEVVTAKYEPVKAKERPIRKGWEDVVENGSPLAVVIPGVRMEKLRLVECRRGEVWGEAECPGGERVKVRLGRGWEKVGHEGWAKEVGDGKWEAVAGPR